MIAELYSIRTRKLEKSNEIKEKWCWGDNKADQNWGKEKEEKGREYKPGGEELDGLRKGESNDGRKERVIVRDYTPRGWTRINCCNCNLVHSLRNYLNL